MALDHANARLIAERLASASHIEIEPEAVRTNIVVFRIAPTGPSAFAVVGECRRQGVLVLAFSERIVRLVTHLDVDAERCRRAADVIADAVGSIAKT
jgi:threonine aldolase